MNIFQLSAIVLRGAKNVDGRLNCIGECDEACVKEFTWREARSIRYREGELMSAALKTKTDGCG